MLYPPELREHNPGFYQTIQNIQGEIVAKTGRRKSFAPQAADVRRRGGWIVPAPRASPGQHNLPGGGARLSSYPDGQRWSKNKQGSLFGADREA